MLYIIQALRTTYHTERKAYPRLNDLIDMLEEDDWGPDMRHILIDIDNLLIDINQPVTYKPLGCITARIRGKKDD